MLPAADGRIGRELAEADIPRTVIDTTLAAEDARFFRHRGVDVLATARAAGQWLQHRRIISGASTITQQLIKLAAPRPRTLRTKIIEAAQAWRLEDEWDKPAILRTYLAHIDYGNGCAGLAEAARHYFGKRPADLDLAESAFLAGLPQAPSRLNPRRRFARAKARQEWILRRCRQLGWITAEAHERAVAETICLAPAAREFAAPHFVDQLLASQLPSPQAPGEVAQRASLNQSRILDHRNLAFHSGEVALRTSLDLTLQRRCEEIVKKHLDGLSAAHVRDGAMVVIENRTGQLLALVGSADWFEPERGQVNGAIARRSPGSALKPFTYLLAFTDGATAADIVADVPAEFATPTGVFQPLNYDRRFRGPVSLREALANSLNVPAVRVLARHGGPERLKTLLQSLGLSTLDRAADEYGLGLTLGTSEVRLLELANAYATLARLGEWLPISMTTSPPPARRRLADPEACWLVADILSDSAARSVAFGLETPLRFDFRVACKTGTSSGFRDNWALGFTPEFTVGVWVGNFDGSPMGGVSGVVGAAPILHDVFVELHSRFGTGWFPPPTGLQTAFVNSLTGHRVADGAGGRREVFVGNHLPPMASSADTDEHGRVQLPPEYGGWATTAENRLGNRVVVVDGQANAPSTALRILTPLPGTVLFLDGDLPETAQRLTLRATARCVWQCASLKFEDRNGQTEAHLAPGRHRLRAVDPKSTRSAETWIEVRRL